MKRINIKKIGITLLTSLLLISGTFFVEEIQNKNVIYAETPGYVKDYSIKAIATGLILYMTKLGIKFTGKMDNIVDWVEEKLIEFGLSAQLLATGIGINLEQKRMLIDNDTLSLYNQFISDYAEENENNDINIDSSSFTEINLFNEDGTPIKYFENTNLNNEVSIISLNDSNFIELNNYYENINTDVLIPNDTNITKYYYFPNNNYYLRFNLNFNLEYLSYPYTDYQYIIKDSNGSSYKYLEYNRKSVQYNIKPYMINNKYYTSSLFSQISTDSVAKFILIKNGNYLYLKKIFKIYDAFNNPQLIINPIFQFNATYTSVGYYCENRIDITSLPQNTITTSTDINNTLANYQSVLNQLENQQEAYALSINGLAENQEDTNALLNNILTRIENGSITTTQTISTETGMTEQEAANSNWYTIISQAINNVFNQRDEQALEAARTGYGVNVIDDVNSMVTDVTNANELVDISEGINATTLQAINYIVPNVVTPIFDIFDDNGIGLMVLAPLIVGLVALVIL